MGKTHRFNGDDGYNSSYERRKRKNSKQWRETRRTKRGQGFIEKIYEGRQEKENVD